jgi:uncharacterized membrane protein
MDKGRLEAFSDGVIAIIITIMVLELKVPHESGINALRPLIPTLLSYVLSFTFLGLYWNNHHHLLKASHHINGKVLWANLHLLFWLSLIPFTTAWIGETRFASWPVATYGIVLFFAGAAYFILTKTLIANHSQESLLVHALSSDFKEKISVLIYALAIPLALAEPLASCVMYVAVALLWLVPDRRIEKALNQHS